SNRRFVPHTGNGFSPSWSPTGNRIVFVTAASGFALFTISPSGSSRRQITSPKGYQEDFDPAWAPNGSWIAYEQVGGTPRARTILTLQHETRRIYLVRPNGRHAHA